MISDTEEMINELSYDISKIVAENEELPSKLVRRYNNLIILYNEERQAILGNR